MSNPPLPGPGDPKRVPDETMAFISEKAVLSKITWRLIPFLFLLYIVAYLDRTNVSFAKLEMGRLDWFSDPKHDVFGLGSGIFFIGYFLFEIPSNLLLEKVGARWWIARIMATWGIIAGAMMFCTSAPIFYGLRFLLGVAEAGFFPGVILYLTYWYTAEDRAKMVALFMTATALANAIGGPVSGAILSLHLPGLANWQWMFILEGIPAVLLAFVVLWYLPDGPRKAVWLTDAERQWVITRISSEGLRKSKHGRDTFAAAFSTPGILPLCLLYFTIAMTTYGVGFWFPTLLKKSGVTNAFYVGLLTAIPYGLAAICMVLNGRHSDKTGERRLHVAGPLLVTAIGLALTAFQTSTLGIMLAMTVALIGIYCPLGPFWSLPTALLGGMAAAAGIAFVNSVGNLGGFAGPALVGLIQGHYPKSPQNGVRAALLMLAGVAVVGCITAVLVRRERTAPPAEEAELPLAEI
jgi:MFS family permease